MTAPTVLLVTGGGRSGKSGYALQRAAGYARRGFVATAEAFDDEMRRRIAKHQAERGNRFETVEAPVELADGIRSLAGRVDVVIVDCLTVWLCNLMFKGLVENGHSAALDDLLALLAAPPMDIILVTNEVGLGIIPGDPMSREYRDLAGLVNQRVAAAAAEVVLVVCGLPLPLKSRIQA